VPDLITADVRLANGSGIAAIQSILQQGYTAPVVFITGNAEVVREALPGAVVVQKPFQDNALRDAIALARQRGSCLDAMQRSAA
jgi:FixJ family two-component response regulator